MMAGCGPKIAKFFLFILNFCLWVCSIVLIAGGAFVTAEYKSYVDHLFSKDTILVVSWTTIGIGVFIFVVWFAGCCGAIRENSCLLKMYLMFVFIIVLAEPVLGILTFVYIGDIEQSLEDGMLQSINETYDLKAGATEAVDDIQKLFHCCGANGYSDYKNSEHLKEGLAVPESCCVIKNHITGITANCTMGAKGQPTYPDLVWIDGCVDASVEQIKKHYIIILAVAFGFHVFGILTMVFACCVISGMNKDGYNRNINRDPNSPAFGG
ncbi:23 kDa integral membrane protein-like [Lytechinus variegatus]|uniref:23 kDa integral membrane protein-like n=1 Tax=Lytechinus variegatus TaxID=7654 RepID=UPI001BB217C9|nr:23 kDa integral membrane protein-like [Lytechinus variegatus]